MRNIALLIEYDGTAYGGWQVQKNAISIQGVIEERLTGLMQEKIKVTGAGRTDAGVHARGQVANFHASRVWSPARLMYALNGILPKDIAVRAVAEVPHDFHARYDAVARRYSYSITPRKTAIGKEFSAFFPFKLSLDSMNSAACHLIGEKNFRSFTKFADEQSRFTCNVTKAEWKIEDEVGERRTENEEREKNPVFRAPCSVLRFEIEANRFLHGMVRAIVGTLIDVGRGKLTVEAFHEIMKAEDRRAASMSAPTCGLFLEEVKYAFDVWEDGRTW